MRINISRVANLPEPKSDDDTELLGYSEIEINGFDVKENNGRLSCIADCVITLSDGRKKYGFEHLSDIDDDLKNGYLKIVKFSR